jgi:cytochrome c-type biogenesis protein CcmH
MRIDRWLTRVVVALMTAAAVLTSAMQPSIALQPDELLDDAQLEARARKISHELRCLVCQNQSIDDSDAPLARDLRLLVRERLKKGDSNEEVVDFIVSRYGEFVLLKPPFGWHTLLLWLTPALVLLGGVWLARSVVLANRSPDAEAEAGERDSTLSPDEEQKLKHILERD